MRLLQVMFTAGGAVTLVVALAGLSWAWLLWAPLVIGLAGVGSIYVREVRSRRELDSSRNTTRR